MSNSKNEIAVGIGSQALLPSQLHCHGPLNWLKSSTLQTESTSSVEEKSYLQPLQDFRVKGKLLGRSS